MKKKLLMIMTAMLMGTIGICHAQDLEPLHVDGRYLKNPKGDIVTLHGWIGDWVYIYYYGNDVASDFSAWKLTVDSILAAGYKLDYARMGCGNPYDSHGSLEEFDIYILPKIDYLNSKGIYVLLFPDVKLYDDGYTRRIGEPMQQRRLMWLDYLSRHPRIKNNPGVMFGLDCEPGTFLGSAGSVNNFKTLKDYYQPMVDLIRSNGCNNVIWVPGHGYQSYYGGYAVYPIEGENIGYDIHFYCNTDLDTYYDTLRERWAKEMEMASNMAPLIITETAWYGEEGEYGRTSTFGLGLKRLCDESGNVSWNLYSEGNIMARVNQPSPDGQPTIYNSPEACYVPFLEWTKEYATTKYTPASELRAERVELENTYTTVYPGDTRPITLMATFANGRRWNVAGDAVWTSSDESVVTVKQGNMHVRKEGTVTLRGEYTDGTGQVLSAEFSISSSLFPLSVDGVSNTGFFIGESSYDETTHTFQGFGYGWHYVTSSYPRGGMPAWNYYGGLDFSAYNYMVLHLDDTVNPITNGAVHISSTHHDGPEAEAVIDLNQKVVVIDLHAYPELELSHIVSVRIDGGEGNGTSIKEIFLSNDGVTPVAEPFTLNTTAKASDIVMYYGDDVPTLTYEVTGPGTVSEPTLSTMVTKISPVGTYDILISGSQDGVTYKPGRLTILPAPLTITPNDVAVGTGMDIPTLTVTYDGFRNGDTETIALSELPTVSTTATKDSPVGNYAITVSGGKADNYLIGDFVQGHGEGTLTITPDLTIALPADRTDHVGTSQEDWYAWGVCSTEYAPAVTTADGRRAQMMETYEMTVEAVGTVMEQTVTGLEYGDYTLVLCANAYYTDGRGFDSDLKEGATDVVCLHANDVTVPMTAHIGTATQKNDEYTMEVTVVNGTLHISMEQMKAGTNWHTLQIKSLMLTKIPSLDEAYARALAEAEELLSQKMSVYARNTLQQAMVTDHTYANYYRLTEAIQQARTNIESNAFAARALKVTKNELLTATNVCTPVAESWYRYSYAAFKKPYDEGLVTDAVAGNYYNPYEGGGGESYDDFKRFLMSAWEYNMENTPYMVDAPYNVSVASAADESGFNNPYIFYHAPEGNTTLEARTLTATMTDMEPGEYTLTAFVRLIAVDGNVAPKGVSLQLCDGTPVPLSGKRFRDWNDYLGHYTAKGTVGEDGVLTVKFIVAADNNVSQLAFRDLWQRLGGIPGDVNSDGEVDIFDVTAIVNRILGTEIENFSEAAADMNGDGEVDIFDVTRVVNVILGVDAEAKVRGTLDTRNGTVLVTTGGNGMDVSVNQAGRYTAMQFDVAVPEGCTLQEVALNCSSDHVLAFAQTGENLYTVVAYSMRNAGFEPTEDALVRLTLSGGGRGKLENGRLVTTDGLYALMDMADGATGIAPLGRDGQEGAIYSLTGQRMGTDAKRLPAGVYIINNKKVTVK